MLFSGDKLVLADQSSLGQIKRKVADVSTSVGIAEKSLGTVADPHVFVAYIRDHRGLRDPEDFAVFWHLHNLLRQRIAAGSVQVRVVAGSVLAKLDEGKAPFETFTNLVDGRKWGKYYNPKKDFLEIKPVPPSSGWWDSIKGAVKKIGAGIVWFGKVVWEVLTKLCERLIKETDSKRRREAAVAVISAAASPAVGASTAAAVELARKICKGVAYVDALNTGAPDAPTGEDVDENKWEGIITAVSARFVRVATATTYPEGSFSVYNPATSTFRILAPGS